MTRLYALDLHPWQSGGRWRDLLPGLPQERQQRAMACRFDADSARAAGAGWLLQYALIQAGVPAPAQTFTKNSWGKPLLADRDAPHFSLSHGGCWVLCAVGDSPLGVDVELPRCTMAIARRFFHPAELESLAAQPLPLQSDSLCRLWTGKEAFVKALGRGLTLPLDSFRITLTPDSAQLEQANSPLPYVLHEYHLELCRACLCTTEEKPELEPVEVS